ncbi:SDR family oxidoreductase [Pseudomonas sp. CR3202]|uniref:SDR family oxidoreductase n=1 Tax=Pseudomonas sp. CR3202 TaxID=3351532 RepID=UPI003BEFB04C
MLARRLGGRSKAGLIGLTQVLLAEFDLQGVRVNAILPAAVDTPMERDTAKPGALRPPSRLGRLGIRDGNRALGRWWGVHHSNLSQYIWAVSWQRIRFRRLT